MKILSTLVLSAVAFVAGTLYLRGSATLAQDPSGDDQPVAAARHAAPDMDTLRTDLEVMRRIVLKRVLDTEQTGAGGLATLDRLFATADRRSSSEVVYVHGDGALLRLTVPYAVAGDTQPTASADRGAQRTLWEDVLDDVEGRPREAPTEQNVFDEDRVAQLEARLVETLTLYGGRIRGLRDADHVTVVVCGRPDGRVTSTRKLSNGSYEIVYADGQKLNTKVEPSARGVYSVRFGSVRETYLTVRVRVGVLRRFAAAPDGAEAVRRAATVHRY